MRPPWLFEDFMRPLLLIIIVTCHQVFSQQQQQPPSEETAPPPPFLGCNQGLLRERWFLAVRTFGDCVRRDSYIEGSKLMMDGQKNDLLLWYGLAFDRADVNRDGNLSETEFLNIALGYYGTGLRLAPPALQDMYQQYLVVNGSTGREAVQNGLYRMETDEIRGREWDFMQRGNEPCVLAASYMRNTCANAQHRARYSFRLYDMNGDSRISPDEHRNTTTTLGRNEAKQTWQWRLLDVNRDGFIDMREMITFTRITLQVL